jgi:hypothetical protein
MPVLQRGGVVPHRRSPVNLLRVVLRCGPSALLKLGGPGARHRALTVAERRGSGGSGRPSWHWRPTCMLMFVAFSFLSDLQLAWAALLLVRPKVISPLTRLHDAQASNPATSCKGEQARLSAHVTTPSAAAKALRRPRMAGMRRAMPKKPHALPETGCA